MNYFEFYEIPVSFFLDEAALKKKYYQNSKTWHPDFYTLEGEAKQAEILQLSTINNEAYKTLMDFHKRLYHILSLNELIEEEGKVQLPQSFLMEMMDVNEELMELQFDYDTKRHQGISEQIDVYKEKILNDIQTDLNTYDHSSPDVEALNKIKDYYYKHKYLLRLSENLDKFAAL